jgi:hypothetical protein
MKQSIYNAATKEEIFRRVDKVTAASKGRWGKLSAPQMLRHLAEANRMALGEIGMPDRSTFLTRTLIKWMFLNNIKPPGREKGKIQTFPEVDIVKKGVATDDIEAEKIRYKRSVQKILDTPALHGRHTAFGKMTREDWGHLAYAHADYHLTQFDL